MTRTSKRNILIAIAATALILMVNLFTPVGYAIWLLYIIPMLIAAPAVSRSLMPALPGAGTLLILLSYFISPPGGNPVRAAVNRLMGAVTLWLVSFIMMRRKQAEEAVQESRRHLENVIDFFPDAVFVVDNEKKVTIWNSAMEAMSGVSKDAMIGQGDRAYSVPFYGERRRQLLDLLDEHDRELEEKYQGVRRTGSILYAEAFCPALYGRGAYIWATVAPLYDADGKRVGAIESIRDTTDRRQAEESLRKSEARFRGYFNLPLIGVAITSPDKQWIEMNDRLCEMLGYSRDELGTRTWAELTHPEDLAADVEKFSQLLSGRIESYTIEKRFVGKNRTVVWTSLGVGCVRKPDGSPEYITALLQDITKRKQAEAERDLLAAAVESSSDAVVITDRPLGTVLYVNKAFEQMTGYPKDEVIGKKVRILDSGTHDEKFYSAITESLTVNKLWTGQMINKKKDGTAYYEACTCFPVIGKTGEVMNYVSVKRDITDKLKLEAIAESVDTMDNIGYIFSGIRHEIGNPISSLLAVLQLLHAKADTAPKEIIKNYVSKALDNVTRVEYLLTSLKSYNMYESPEYRDVSLGSFLDKFLSLISEDFKGKGIEISRTAAGDDETLRVDPRALQQIMLNIFTNAADALQGCASPKIEVLAASRDGMVELSIRDNGCGMTAEQQKKLFKPFYTSKPHGTGLGMVIVKKMITKMNGLIEVKSKAGDGTTVALHLPKAKGT